MTPRLAIVCTHPIQYFAPVFRSLADQSLHVKVFYGWEGTGASLDHGFGRAIDWDIPLLDGYDYEFSQNIATDPGSHHFRGMDSPSLPAAIERWKADAVLIYGWCYKSHLKVMRHFHPRLPILFRGDSTLLNEQQGIKRWIRRRVLRWVYRHVDAALYVGTHNRAYYLAHGLREDQLYFAPHAIDNQRFADDEADASGQRLRAAHGIDDHDIVVLFPGKLEAIKQPQMLADAHRLIDRAHVHLVFAGSGPLEVALQRTCSERTHFLGFQNQSQMPAVYRMCDLICLPSKSETWGLVVNEAMASSRPVMASDHVGAAIDLIQPGQTGWIFNATHVGSLADCLTEASQFERAGLHKMGDNARRLISDWSIDKQVIAIADSVRDRLSR